MNAAPAALVEIRTTAPNGARASVIVPAKLAGLAYRSAMARAWRGQTGALVEALAFTS